MIPDAAAELDETLDGLKQDGLIERSCIEELSRDLALAESRIEQLELELVAAGVMDPELGP